MARVLVGAAHLMGEAVTIVYDMDDVTGQIFRIIVNNSLPQPVVIMVSHAIGNRSFTISIPTGTTERNIPGNRPLNRFLDDMVISYLVEHT